MEAVSYVPDSVMLVLTAAATVGSVYYGVQHKDYVVGIWWTISLGWMAIFFAILTFGILPIADQMDLRLSMYRPSNALFLLGVIVFTANGRVNRLIDKLLRRG